LSSEDVSDQHKQVLQELDRSFKLQCWLLPDPGKKVKWNNNLKLKGDVRVVLQYRVDVRKKLKTFKSL